MLAILLYRVESRIIPTFEKECMPMLNDSANHCNDCWYARLLSCTMMLHRKIVLHTWPYKAPRLPLAPFQHLNIVSAFEKSIAIFVVSPTK